MMLYEKYNPDTWRGFVGHQRIVAVVRRIIESPDYTGGGFLITGPSGTGKSTLARIIAHKLAPEPCNRRILKGDQAGKGAVHELIESMRHGSMFGHTVVTVNECHATTAAARDAWLNLFEPDQRPKRTTFIFTTTEYPCFGDAQDTLESRMVSLKLQTGIELRDQFAEFARVVAECEGLGGADLEDYQRAVEDANYNLRRVLQMVQGGEFVHLPAEYAATE